MPRWTERIGNRQGAFHNVLWVLPVTMVRCCGALHGRFMKTNTVMNKQAPKCWVRRFTCATLVCAALVLSAGCAVQTHQTNPRHEDAADASAVRGLVFSSARYGVQLRYPATLELHRDFSMSYLSNGAWKTYAGPGAPPGEPLVALVMPTSNEVTAGELRIGVSRDPEAIRSCKSIPAAALPDSVGTTIIDGVPFTTFKARDAGMSHYLIVRSYRAVHDSTCYAMDVLVYGTNPKVYDPPRTPPFTAEQVFARLVPVAEALQFTASANVR